MELKLPGLQSGLCCLFVIKQVTAKHAKSDHFCNIMQREALWNPCSRIQSFSSLKSWAPLVAASVRGRRLGGKLCCQLVIGMQSSWWEHNPHKLTLRWLRRINFHVWWNQERLVTGVQCLFSLSLTFWVKWMPGCGKWPERLGHRLGLATELSRLETWAATTSFFSQLRMQWWLRKPVTPMWSINAWCKGMIVCCPLVFCFFLLLFFFSIGVCSACKRVCS